MNIELLFYRAIGSLGTCLSLAYSGLSVKHGDRGTASDPWLEGQKKTACQVTACGLAGSFHSAFGQSQLQAPHKTLFPFRPTYFLHCNFFSYNSA